MSKDNSNLLYYKIDVLKQLKAAGYNTNKIRKLRLISEPSLTAIRQNRPISWATLATICELLDMQPGDIIGRYTNQETLKGLEEAKEEEPEEDQEESETLEHFQDRSDEAPFLWWDFIGYWRRHDKESHSKYVFADTEEEENLYLKQAFEEYKKTDDYKSTL